MLKNILYQHLIAVTLLRILQKEHRWGNFWSVGAAWRISQREILWKITLLGWMN